ncbi:MAG: tripartite tricarboxylate transporter TctB family protein [Planctomycetota bacterium]|jgi:putative tricarboxylic transport membrane protein|nr:tripartite tricarboxylate transporter TctB family protein [Planctomycetota bacterium]
MGQKYREVVSGCAFLLLGAIMFAASFSIPKGAEMGVGAGFMPRLMSILLVLGGLAVAAQGWPSGVTRLEAGGRSGNYRAVILSIAYLGAFVVLLPKFGFVITAAAYIFLQTILFCPRGNRDYRRIGIVAAVAAVAIYLVFAKGFKLLLPAGILG